MAVTQSSKTQQQQKPPPQKPPPPANAVARAATVLAGSLSPVLAFDGLISVIPLLGLAAGVSQAYGKSALRLALQEAERYIPPVVTPISRAQREVAALNNQRRAGYIVAATKRIAEALEKAQQEGLRPEQAIAEARTREDHYFNQHARATAERTQAASHIDALANQYGNLLGWYAKKDKRTTPECADADGKNFRVDNPPDIGYPGIVHLYCRCKPGAPHPGGEEMDGGTPTVIAAANYQLRVVELVRHVRTAAGAEFFHEPIGTPITEADYERVKAERAAAAKAHRNAQRRAKGPTTQVRGSMSRMVTREDDKRKLGGQTKSNFEHPFTGKPMTKTEIGDTYEQLFNTHGAQLLAKKFPGQYLPVSHAEGGSRTTPLDFQLNHTFGGELKTLSARSQNQKTAIKKDEIERKLSALTGAKLKPLLVVQVVDQDTGTVEVYAFPNFVSKQVRSMEYVGSYSYTNDDFKRAQLVQGHWKGAK